MTLLELMVVIAIVAALGGIVAFRFTPDSLTFGNAGGGKTSARLATETTLNNVRAAILGTATTPSYWDDMNRDAWLWPQDLRWLGTLPSTISPGSINSPYYMSLMTYDPAKKIGWRGPYLQFTGTVSPVDNSKGFTARIGAGSTGSPLDGWGRPIYLQLPAFYAGQVVMNATGANSAAAAAFLYQNCRIVSAGANGVMDTELNAFGSGGSQGPLVTYDDFVAHPELVKDDVVIWLYH